MDVQVIDQIKEAFSKGQSYHKIMRFYHLNNAQGYAINILGKDMQIPSSNLAGCIENIREDMTMAEIIKVLNLSLEQEVC